MSNVPTQSTEMTRHGTPGLRLTFLNTLARLESSGLQLFQLLLRRDVGVWMACAWVLEGPIRRPERGGVNGSR
jgi:hypothetical protein